MLTPIFLLTFLLFISWIPLLLIGETSREARIFLAVLIIGLPVLNIGMSYFLGMFRGAEIYKLSQREKAEDQKE